MAPATPDAPAPPDQPVGWRARVRRAIHRKASDAGIENLPLRWRFRLVVVTFALPFFAYVLWTATQQAGVEKEHVREEARADATLLATRYEDHIEQVDRLLATAAQAVGANIADVDAIDALLQNMRGIVPKDLDNIGVWGLDGHNIASLDRRARAQVNIADRHYFMDAVAKRALGFEGPITSRTTGKTILMFGRPVFDAHGETVGVISMALRPADLAAALDEEGTLGASRLVTVVDRRGIVLARSVEPTQWIGKPAMTADEAAPLFEARNGMRETLGPDGEPVLQGFATVGRWPWVVTVGEPAAQVLGPTSLRLLRNLGVGFAILALAFVVAGRIAQWTIAPLRQLASDTERLRSGELSHRSAVTTGGEIARLATDFNRMAAALQSRERALAASRTQLRAIADNIPEQITYVDHEERYRFVNACPGPFRNFDPVAMIGKTVLEVRGPDFYDAIAPALHRAMAGEATSGERSMVLDGRQVFFFVTYVPDVDAEGRVLGVYAFAQDITQRKLAEIALVQSEQRLVTITDNLPAMISYVDDERRFRFANQACEEWLGRPLADIIGKPFDRLMAPEIAARFDYYFLRGMRGETLDYEMELPLPDGTRWLKCSLIPDIDEVSGRTRGVYGMMHNVTMAKEAERRLTRLAQYDTLTGLANRHSFNETLAAVLVNRTPQDAPLALMFLDVDHFKQVNDRWGHASGDLLLKDFAQRLVDGVRPTDTVARLSGDEFVVLLQGLHSDEEPQFIARKIVAAIEKPFILDGVSLRVTTSIGIAMQRHLDEAASTLMKRADEALYEAKRAGRNTFRMAG